MKNSGSLIAAFFGGAIIGGLVGAYLMSENGKDIRKKMKDLLENSESSNHEDQTEPTENTNKTETNQAQHKPE